MDKERSGAPGCVLLPQASAGNREVRFRPGRTHTIQRPKEEKKHG